MSKRNILLFRAKTAYRYFRQSPSAVMRRVSARLYNNSVGRLTAGRRLGTVAMLHLGRTGSTVLGDLLDQHPQIMWDSEIYYDFLIGYQNHTDDLDAWRQQAMEELPRRVKRSGSRFYGFEAQFFHIRLLDLSLSDYIAYLRRNRVTHYILLERRNYLRSLVSYITSVKGKDKFLHNPNGKTDLVKVKINIERIAMNGENCSLIDFLDRYTNYYRESRELLANEKMLYLSYEDDIATDPSVGARQVFEFLGLTPHNLSVRYGKTNPFKLSDMIENFDEVEQTLRDTPYAWMTAE